MRDYMLRRRSGDYIAVSDMTTADIEKILGGTSRVELSGRQGFTLPQLTERLRIELDIRELANG